MHQTSSASPRTARSRAALATILGMLALTGCGSDGGGGGEVVPGPSISPILDTDRESSASLGPEGGTVMATAADGTEYALSIPADALIDETEIVLTPIISVDDLPMSGGFIAGVHFEPSGLELFRTAELRVTQPAAPNLAADEALAGFVYDGAGENLGLALAFLGRPRSRYRRHRRPRLLRRLLGLRPLPALTSSSAQSTQAPA